MPLSLSVSRRSSDLLRAKILLYEQLNFLLILFLIMRLILCCWCIKHLLRSAQNCDLSPTYVSFWSSLACREIHHVANMLYVATINCISCVASYRRLACQPAQRVDNTTSRSHCCSNNLVTVAWRVMLSFSSKLDSAGIWSPLQFVKVILKEATKHWQC